MTLDPERKTERKPTDNVGRFVYTPSNQSPKMVLAVRAHDPSKALVHVYDAPRGLSDLVCPDCGSRVVANQGEVRRPYYSHHNKDECAHAGETAIHLLAKTLILPGRDELRLPAATFEWDGKVIKRRSATRATFDRLEMEKWEAGLRPDLIGIRDTINKDGMAASVRLVIEIRVTHAVDEEKRAELQR